MLQHNSKVHFKINTQNKIMFVGIWIEIFIISKSYSHNLKEGLISRE